MNDHRLSDTRFFLALMILLVVTSMSLKGVAAQSDDAGEILFDPVDIKAMIHSNGTTTIIFEAQVHYFGLDTLTEVEVRVDSLDITIVSASSDDEATSATVEQMDRHSMITVDLQNGISAGETKRIQLQILSGDLQSSMGITIDSIREGNFVYYMRPHIAIANVTFIAFLPNHAFLAHTSSVPLFPKADANFTDGESLAFVWHVSSLQPGQESVFIVQFQEYTDPVVEAQDPLLSSVLLSTASFIAGLMVSKVGPRMVSRLRRIRVVQYQGLTSEEEKIVDALKTKGGFCPQKELYHQLDMSESKLSLVLAGMEERGLVKRFREGRQNVVHIIEK